MFLVDCHCDTLSELYKQNKSLYANNLMLDAERILRNGGGLQFMAMFIPTEVFRSGAGATYTLKLIDTYLRGLREVEEKGVKVNRILSKKDLEKLPNPDFNALLAEGVIHAVNFIRGQVFLLKSFHELSICQCTTVFISFGQKIFHNLRTVVFTSSLSLCDFPLFRLSHSAYPFPRPRCSIQIHSNCNSSISLFIFCA